MQLHSLNEIVYNAKFKVPHISVAFKIQLKIVLVAFDCFLIVCYI